jgi:Ca2+-binding RTX toxin-like protein
MKLRVALTAVAGAVALLIALPSVAGAYSISCSSTDEAGGMIVNGNLGETNVFTLASKMKAKTVGVKARGADKDGMAFMGEFACTSPPASSGYRSVSVFAGSKNDVVRADAKGASTIQSQPGFRPLTPAIDLVLNGAGGNDKLIGHKGDGVLKGGGGKDTIIDTGGNDVIKGGGGRDVIHAKDGQRDLIDCGGGNDKVKADKKDVVVSNC